MIIIFDKLININKKDKKWNTSVNKKLNIKANKTININKISKKLNNKIDKVKKKDIK